MANGWNDERKLKARDAIHRWRPWEKATGPKTQEGKCAVSMNALKHGMRSQAAQDERRALRRVLSDLSYDMS